MFVCVHIQAQKAKVLFSDLLACSQTKSLGCTQQQSPAVYNSIKHYKVADLSTELRQSFALQKLCVHGFVEQSCEAATGAESHY